MTVILQVSVVALMSCLVYSGVARGPFLYDDTAALLGNADVQGNSSFWKIWSNDFWGVPMDHWSSHLSYRPLTVLFYRCLHSIWENWATPFHISNIILHAVVSSLFFLVCRKHVFDQDQTEAPFMAGLLFSLHPIHTEAVCGIVGCAELLSALCFFTSLMIYPVNHCDSDNKLLKINKSKEKTATTTNTSNCSKLKSNEETTLRHRKPKVQSTELEQNHESGFREASNGLTRKNPRKLFEHYPVLFSAILATAAMLCKESGISVMGILIVCEAIQTVIKTQSSSKWYFNLRFHIRSAFICAVGFSLFVFRMWMMNWRQPTFQDYDNPVIKLENRSSRIMSYFSLCWVNFGILLHPVNLCYDYSFPTVPLITSIWHQRNIISLAFLALCVFCVIIIIKCFTNKQQMSKPFVMGCAMLVVPYLPASNLFFPVGFVIAERCLYLPSAGFVILIVWICSVVMKLFPSSQRLLQVAAATLMIAYFMITAKRSLDWTSKERLFKSGLEANPNSAKIIYNWGSHLYSLNRTTEAEARYRKSLELNPNFISALHNLAVCKEHNRKEWPKVEEMYDEIIRKNPGRVLAHVNLAGVRIKLQKFEKAVETSLRAIKHFAPEHLDKFAVIAKRLVDQNKSAEAQVIYYHLLNKVCSTENDQFETERCRPGYEHALKEYAHLLEKIGRKKKSTKLDVETIATPSNDPNTLLNLSKTMLSVGDAKGASTMMLKAAKLDSSKLDSLWIMASELFQKRYFAESKLLHEYYVNVFPNKLEAVSHYAGALIENGEAERGESMLRNIITNDHDCQQPGALSNLATIYGRRSQHEEAIGLLNSCLEKRKISTQSCNEGALRSKLLTQLAKHGKYRSKQLLQESKQISAEKLWKKSLKHIYEALRLDPSYEAAKYIRDEMEKEKVQWN